MQPGPRPLVGQGRNVRGAGEEILEIALQPFQPQLAAVERRQAAVALFHRPCEQAIADQARRLQPRHGKFLLVAERLLRLGHFRLGLRLRGLGGIPRHGERLRIVFSLAAFLDQLRTGQLPQSAEHHGRGGGGSREKQGPPGAPFRPAALVRQHLALGGERRLVFDRVKPRRHFHHRRRALRRVERQAAVDPFAESRFQRVLCGIRPAHFRLGVEISGDFQKVRMDSVLAGHPRRRCDEIEGLVTSRKTAGEDAIGQHPERENVPAVARLIQIAGWIAELLRSLIEHRVRELEILHARHVAHRPVAQQGFGIVGEKDIPRLQIAVSHAPLVHPGERAGQRPHQFPRAHSGMVAEPHLQTPRSLIRHLRREPKRLLRLEISRNHRYHSGRPPVGFKPPGHFFQKLPGDRAVIENLRHPLLLHLINTPATAVADQLPQFQSIDFRSFHRQPF